MVILYSINMIMVSTDFAQRNPEAVERLLRALRKAWPSSTRITIDAPLAQTLRKEINNEKSQFDRNQGSLNS